MRRIVGLGICILLSCLLLATPSMAVKQAEIELSGGLGVKVTITNVGDEPIKGQPVIYVQKKYFPRDEPTGTSPGMGEPLQPNESLTWREVNLLSRPLYRLRPGPGIPVCSVITINAVFFQNGEGIISEKAVDALYLCGFVILF